MTNTSWKKLIDEYLEYASRSTASDEVLDSLAKAYDSVTNIVEGHDPQAAFELVMALLNKAPSHLLDYVAAGPLEDLLCHHGIAVLDGVLEVAKRDVSVQRALVGVWGRERMGDEIWERLQTAIVSWKH
jgi:hypothetical protein